MSDFSFEDIVASELIKETIKDFYKKIKSYFANKSKSESIINNNEINFDLLISRLFIEMYNWSSSIEFIGIADPVNISTINLNYYFSYRDENPKVSQAEISETQIFKIDKNIIIEGAPGSGKTTTLKRLLFFNFFSGTTNTSFDFPLLIRLRLMDSKYNLYSYICFLLGIKIEQKSYETTKKVTKSRPIFNEKREVLRYEDYEEDEKNTVYNEVVGDESIERFIGELLEKNKVLLLIDGIDEVNPVLLNKITQNVYDLMTRIKSAKVIITTRPDYIKYNDNCIKLRIKELNHEQQEAITKLWVKDFSLFLNELQQKSYKELANKPLFLTFLILLYNENLSTGIQGLPPNSIDVYTQVVELIIVKWDRSRNIPNRPSRYSNFHNAKKEEFLCELAFFLMYQMKQKVFSTQNLESAYYHICDNYSLPPEEAKQVAEEIQSHIGLILRAGFNQYEFSHLSLQEFLCAKYIIKTASDENIFLYLQQYPQPLALCVSLSGDSSAWLDSFLLPKLIAIPDLKERSLITSQILGRLIIENPYFRFNLKLGAKLLELSSTLDFSVENVNSNFHNFVKNNPNVEKAAIQILSYYKKKQNHLHMWGKITFSLILNKDSFYPDTISLVDSSYLLNHITN